MGQTTLDAFLTASAPRRPEDALDPDIEASCSTHEEAQRRNVARRLLDRDVGQSGHSRYAGQLQRFFPYQQVACMLPSSTNTGVLCQQAAVTDMAINQATGTVAWVQANGKLHACSMERLRQAAGSCEQRAREHAKQHQEPVEIESAGTASSCEDTASMRRQRSWLASTCGALHSSKCYNAGSRLEALAFDPRANCKLALVGAIDLNTSVLLLDLGKASPTYQRLTIPKQPHSRLTAIQYLGPSHRYSLAASDRRAVYLWDPRQGTANAAELQVSARLATAVQALPRTSLLCAVTEQQQLMIWDLRQGSASAGVQTLGGGGAHQHAVVACRDLLAPLAAAHAQMGRTVHTSRPSHVQAMAAHPCDASTLGFMLMNLSTAVYSVALNTFTHLTPSPALFHTGTDPSAQQAAMRAVNSGNHMPKCSWDAAGTGLWFPTPVIRPWSPGDTAAGQTVRERSGWRQQQHQERPWLSAPVEGLGHDGDGGMADMGEGPVLPGAGLLRYTPPGSRGDAWLDSDIPSADEASDQAFRLATEQPGMWDTTSALQAAGAEPVELLPHMAAAAGLLRAGSDGNVAAGSSVTEDGARCVCASVRRWEDCLRHGHGPKVVAVSDWPTCFASSTHCDEVLMGTRSGRLVMTRPGRAL